MAVFGLFSTKSTGKKGAKAKAASAKRLSHVKAHAKKKAKSCEFC